METSQAGNEVCYERGRIWTLEGLELITVIKRDSGRQEMGVQQMKPSLGKGWEVGKCTNGLVCDGEARCEWVRGWSYSSSSMPVDLDARPRDLEGYASKPGSGEGPELRKWSRGLVPGRVSVMLHIISWEHWGRPSRQVTLCSFRDS